MKHYPPKNFHTMKGFTLIEFLVASMLAMIVILAASGTYLITRKLNGAAQERISTQQDIRNASVQMARDARMAGSFGCFSTGDNGIANKEFPEIKVKDIIELNPDNSDGFGVRLIDKTKLTSAAGFSGLNNPSNGLMFIYGQSATSARSGDLDKLTQSRGNQAASKIDTLENVFFNVNVKESSNDADVLRQSIVNKGHVVLSTCSAIAAGKGVSISNSTVKVSSSVKESDPLEIKAYQEDQGEFNISKLNASLYVLGEITRGGTQWSNEKALLRYDLGADGNWSSPQLLAMGINDTGGNGMTLNFGYVDPTDACKDENNVEKFIFVANPTDSTNTLKRPPALVQMRLKYYTNKANSNSAQSDAETRDYIINTTVRAGNTCATRVIKKTT